MKSHKIELKNLISHPRREFQSLRVLYRKITTFKYRHITEGYVIFEDRKKNAKKQRRKEYFFGSCEELGAESEGGLMHAILIRKI